MKTEKCTAIVLAAGQGKRMGTSVQKQFLNLQGRPLICYTLENFQRADCIHEIILVTGKESLEYCRKEIVETYGYTKVKKVVEGGKERYDSVYQGLLACQGADYVFIHDGARIFADEKLISRGYEQVQHLGSAVAAVPSKDTIKVAAGPEHQVESTPDRSSLWCIQTPQIFAYDRIRAAYDKIYESDRTGITDDAMVLERFSEHKVYLFEGSYRNIKITTPEDLLVAEAFLKAEQQEKSV
ncbi:MAG: 2-C-methyl-D-erythritol 4-phosphate cytidylyltransferase [Lachnospiraceae bacterium]|nr:2-C-methyl-D-erythritol 4-phosphate cytidylyltransferase [Lachnospiraceae bacterium]